MPRRRPLVGNVSRGSIFTNYDGSPSFYYNQVQPAAGAQYLQQLNAAQGGGSVSYNPNYYNMPFGRNELRKNQAQEQAANAQQQARQEFEAQMQQGQLEDHFLGAGNPSSPEVTSAAIQSELIGGGASRNAEPIQNPFVGTQSTELGTPEDAAFADTMQQRSAADRREAAEAYMAIGKMKASGIPDWRLRPAYRKYMEKYGPPPAGGFTALTSKQQQEIKQKLKLQEHQTQLNSWAKQNGVEAPPLTLNDKGVPAVPDGVAEVMRSTGELRRSENQHKKDMFEAQIKSLDAMIPDDFDPTMASELEKTRYQRLVDDVKHRKNEVFKKMFGEDMEGMGMKNPTLARAVMLEREALLSSLTGGQPSGLAVDPGTGLEVVQSDADYARIRSGQPFIDPNGERRIKP